MPECGCCGSGKQGPGPARFASRGKVEGAAHGVSEPPLTSAAASSSSNSSVSKRGCRRRRRRRLLRSHRLPDAGAGARQPPLETEEFAIRNAGTKVPVLLEKSISIIVDVPIREAFEALEAGLCPHRNFALTIRWSRNSQGHSARARSAPSFTSSAITQFVTSSPLSSVMIRRSPSMPTICARLCGGRLNACDLAGFQTVGGFSQTVSDAFPFLPCNELRRVHRPSIPCGSDHSTCSAWSFLLDMAPALWRREACSAGSAPYRASV